MTAARELAKAGNAVQLTKADILLTVGPNGQFSTLTLAVTAASKALARPYAKIGVTVEIRLLAGFLMEEQIIARKVDLGFITITSVNEYVPVKRNAITTIVSDRRKPLFGAIDNAVTPIIDCKFEFSEGTELQTDGIAVFNNSRSMLTSRAGFKKASRPLGAYYSSEITCYEDGDSIEAVRVNVPDFSYAYDTGIYCTFNSKVGVGYGNFSYASNHGCIAIWGSQIDCYFSDFSYAGRSGAGHGVYARDGSLINARVCRVDHAASHGFYALHNSRINARCKPLEGYPISAEYCGGIGVFAQHNSSIDAEEVRANNCGSVGIVADQGSNISARSAVCSFSLVGAQAQYGSILNVNGLIATDCPNQGIFATNTSKVEAAGAVLDRAGINAVLAEEISDVNVEGGSGKNAGVISVYCRRGSRVGAYGFQGQFAGARGCNAQNGASIDAGNADFRKTAGVDTTGNSGDMVVFDGSTINAKNGIGGKNVTVNTISTNGIIFA